MKKSQLFLGAAVAGLVGAASIGATPSALAGGKSTIGFCKGANSCAGKSACGAMKGKNSCSGEGYLKMTKAACKKKDLVWSLKPAPEEKAEPKPAT